VPGELAQALDDLQAKGLAPAAVAQAMLDLKDYEFARAQNIWQKKYGSPALDANERAKHYRFLLTRGFSSEVVRKVVKLSGASDEDFEQ
jgi:regulatory protein